ncbi:MFS transporter [Chryseobacterium sp. POL2]|uniref:MFS transporter n=1 Tax=Chryseobacterium sp. POL2 TaxID=2713414 RepID=UPI0013E1FB56|nr:MFS transporter [Chryseobacterium sp. POL2]QIG88412.1 MFS transporter [Chryseobacterium sp. POL2]
MYNQGIFNNWVPKPVQLLLIILFAGILMPMSGIYTGNLTFMMSDTGTMTEYYMMANFASSIGMGAIMPIAVRLKLRFKIRDKVTFILVLLALLLFVNGTTDNPWIIIINCLLIGFLKMAVIMEFMLPLMMITPSRGAFYSILYGFVLTLSQLVNYYVVEYSILYNWEYFFILTAIICLILALISWIFMHDKRFALKMPMYYIDWMSMLMFIATFTMLSYVLSFGKQQDWFNSSYIIWNSIGFLVTFILLIVRQSFLKRPFLSFNIFKKNNVVHGLFMLFCLGIYMALGSMQTSFAIGVLQYDQLTNAKLNLLMIPGLIVGAIVAIVWFKHTINLRMFVFSGFGAMLMFTIILYFSMVPEMNFERWYLPMFLKGYGMCSLFIAVWYYTMDKLEVNDLLPAFGFVLCWRSFITIGFFSALFSWIQYQFQIQAIGDLAVHWDSLQVSQQAVMTQLKPMQLNAMLVANKKLLGYIIYAGFLIQIYVYFHRFGKTKYTQIRMIRVLKGKAFIAKRRRREQIALSQTLNPIKDAGGINPL